MSVVFETGFYDTNTEEDQKDFSICIKDISDVTVIKKGITKCEDYQFMIPILEMGNFIVGNQVFNAQPGLVYFIKKNIAYGAQEDLVNTSYYRIHIKKDFFESIVNSLPDVKLEKLPDFAEIEETEQIRQLLCIYKKEHQESKNAFDGIKRSLSIAFVSILVRQLVNQQPINRIKIGADTKIEEIAQYLIDNFDKEICNTEISRVFKISKYYLIKRFFAVKNTTPMAFLADVRLQKAKEMILEGGMPFGKVAEKCGYSSLDYFSKAFKKAEGISPRLFKQKNSK